MQNKKDSYFTICVIIFRLFSVLNGKGQVYDIQHSVYICVFLFQFLKQVTDFHETSYKRYAIRRSF
jgi:hypothetical protein